MNQLYTELHRLVVEPSGNVSIYSLETGGFFDKVHSMSEALSRVSAYENGSFPTKGPWSRSFNHNPDSMNGVGTVSVQGPKGIICECEESEFIETMSNARLIAAAPVMLEALEQAKIRLEIADLNDSTLDAIKRALLIAKGT